MVIADLIEAVERGSLDGYATDFSLALGAHAQHAANAYYDDLNAAVALLEAVLSGWDWQVLSDGEAYVTHDGRGLFDAEADNRARAALHSEQSSTLEKGETP